jgi:hypothetical protein
MQSSCSMSMPIMVHTALSATMVKHADANFPQIEDERSLPAPTAVFSVWPPMQ